MKFNPFSRQAISKEIKHPVYNEVSKEIDAYLNFAFKANYVALKSTGKLEKFIDDSEVIYNDAFQMLQDINHKSNTYLNDDDKMTNYMNLALSLVFQDINKKFYVNKHQ
ncbi:hypothetical protein IMCC3317_45300 [Kordia antarctica]|uniref:Uncharacterized protein n=1 Tax=Kordia antarctica TaxID=1218801 RepID=A0A7L4ZRM6_9FLAO|nr:hypothetical protein [Kordia antarctica]QHI39129.1 hypothetical protein IMCC3317_45300 [Kordia antarctica]